MRKLFRDEDGNEEPVESNEAFAERLRVNQLARDLPAFVGEIDHARQTAIPPREYAKYAALLADYNPRCRSFRDGSPGLHPSPMIYQVVLDMTDADWRKLWRKQNYGR